MGRKLSMQNLRNFIAPGSGVGILDRAKKFVGLKDQFATGPVLVVHDERLDAPLAQFDGRRQSCRACADD